MSEEIDQDMNEEGDIILEGSREENWGDVAEDRYDKNNIHYLRSDVYIKEKEELIYIYFWCPLLIQKGGTLLELV